MVTWQDYLDKAAAYHGHICGGQILGIRMAQLGLKLLGLTEGDNLRDLVIFLETDRCVADAAYVVTGLTLGRRRVKLKHYGKTAMSFMDLGTGKAYRIRVKMREHPAPGTDIVAYWTQFSDDDIFEWYEVEIDLPPSELPGKPQSAVICHICGEEVLDCKEVLKDGRIYCRNCEEGSYYKRLDGGTR